MRPFLLYEGVLLTIDSPTADGEIGVITPYYAQARKISATLRGVADGVKVGSVVVGEAPL